MVAVGCHDTPTRGVCTVAFSSPWMSKYWNSYPTSPVIWRLNRRSAVTAAR